MEEQLRQAVAQAIGQVYPNITTPIVAISRPDQPVHGDYTTNVAFVVAKEVKVSPFEVAEALAAALMKIDEVDEVTVVRPGFINFRLKVSYLLTQLKALLEQPDQFGRSALETSQKVLFEFGQPNTHKVPHIGHLFSYCYGESCCRILDYAGYEVYRANYQGDVGLHVAKCLWAFRQKTEIPTDDLGAKVNFLQSCYQEGSLAYDESEQAKHEIDELNRLIYHKDPTILAVWEETRNWSLMYYRQFEKRIGARYDRFYLESETSQLGKELVVERVGKIFEEDEGAVIFRGEQYGLHTRVFINKFGNPTYEAKDVGLAAKKREDFTVDRSIVTTASEQTPYWQVVKKAIELIFPDLVDKIEHIGFGMINLSTGKMSSRTGKILTAFSLVETVKERVKDYIDENRDYSEVEKENIAELVAIGAIKYSFLRSNPLKNITFDLESSVAFDGNSGPYLQYTYARTQSILRKAADLHSERAIDDSLVLNEDELTILRWLTRFSENVAAAAAQRSPHILANYLFELAQGYSYFYNQHQVISDNYKTTAVRLALTEAVGHTLKIGLELLGMPVLEKI